MCLYILYMHIFNVENNFTCSGKLPVNTKTIFLSYFRVNCWKLVQSLELEKGEVAAVEMACISKLESPGCLRSRDGPFRHKPTGSPWEELLPGGCLERPSDHRSKWAWRKQGTRAAHPGLEALVVSRNLRVGERFVAMELPPIEPLRSPGEREVSFWILSHPEDNILQLY